jgi:hypothetical protein
LRKHFCKFLKRVSSMHAGVRAGAACRHAARKGAARARARRSRACASARRGARWSLEARRRGGGPAGPRRAARSGAEVAL